MCQSVMMADFFELSSSTLDTPLRHNLRPVLRTLITFSASLRELTDVHTCTLQRREEIQKHNVKEDNTILLQFRSRDEEAAVSLSMIDDSSSKEDRRSKGGSKGHTYNLQVTL